MTIIDTINTLQIICLILLGWIIFMVGWLFGAIFTKKYRVWGNTAIFWPFENTPNLLKPTEPSIGETLALNVFWPIAATASSPSVSTVCTQRKSVTYAGTKATVFWPNPIWSFGMERLKKVRKVWLPNTNSTIKNAPIPWNNSVRKTANPICSSWK